jgi:hypothetical protein
MAVSKENAARPKERVNHSAEKRETARDQGVIKSKSS